MFKRVTCVVLILAAMQTNRLVGLSAEERMPSAYTNPSSVAGRSLLGSIDAAAATGRSLQARNGHGDDSKRESRRGSRKLMWITIAASVAAVAVAASLAPEASIPTTPTRRSGGGCTLFYRPGTLMTTSGYTCRSR